VSDGDGRPTLLRSGLLQDHLIGQAQEKKAGADQRDACISACACTDAEQNACHGTAKNGRLAAGCSTRACRVLFAFLSYVSPSHSFSPARLVPPVRRFDRFALCSDRAREIEREVDEEHVLLASD
jgi:hypothetical protein